MNADDIFIAWLYQDYGKGKRLYFYPPGNNPWDDWHWGTRGKTKENWLRVECLDLLFLTAVSCNKRVKKND